MVVTHEVALDMLNLAHHADYIATQNACGNLAVKLHRTYTAQLEALSRLRCGGEQTVRVEHVHVHSGGQAIVGAVTGAGPVGGGREGSDNPMQRNNEQPSTLRDAPRCGAKTRSGSPCQSPR
jgi:hypothetical protein